ncbi:MAG: carbohydrate ABC transporter permease [Deinococcus sp.]
MKPSLSATPARLPAASLRRERPWLLPLPGFLFLAAVTFPPLFYALYLAFVNVDSSLPQRPVSFVFLQNFKAILLGASGQQAILTTGLLSFGATILAITVGIGVAYLLHTYGGRFTMLLTVLILVPMAVSPVAMALTFSLILNPLYGPLPQVLNQLGGPLVSVTASPPGAILTIICAQAWQWSPLAVVLLLGGIQSLPSAPFEAARLDGASAGQLFRFVMLPLLRPIIVVTALFEFILCSQLFGAAQLLTNGGPGTATTDLSFLIYKIGVSDAGRVSEAAAAGLLALIGAIVVANIWLRVSRWEDALN